MGSDGVGAGSRGAGGGAAGGGAGGGGVPPRIPGYLVEALVGSGASSRVFRGRAQPSGDPVALKYVMVGGTDGADPASTDAGLTAAARAEASLLTVLDHPNLVRLHSFVPVRGGFVLVLDLAAGGSLAQLLAARGRLSPGEAISALAPVGAALAHVHDAGVVHGDVSPANVLFSESGVPMLADLGVARMLGERSAVHTTPGYIDPGVAAGFVPSSHSDVFMLAAVAVHVLTGSPLWRGATPSATLVAALTADLSDLPDRLRAAAVPQDMATVVCRALSLEPARRGSAAEFALDFRYAGTPVAVELAAGRARPEPVRPEPVRPEPVRPEPVRPDPVAAEPSIVEQAIVEQAIVQQAPVELDVPGDPAQTRAVHAPPRPRTVDSRRARRRFAFRPPRLGTRPGLGTRLGLGSRPRAGRRPRGGGRRRRATWWDEHRRLGFALVGAVALLAVGAGVAFGVAGGSGDAPGSRALRSPVAGGDATPQESTIGNAPVAVAGTVESIVGAPPPSGTVSGTRASSTPAPPVTDSAVAAIMVQLDALREGAFARRAPLLLTGVYEPGPLLDEDTAALQRIVPTGCGLEGVHTGYTNVRVISQSADSVNLTATATLAPSVLFCDGTAKAKAPGAGPSNVHIGLLRSRGGWLISTVTS